MGATGPIPKVTYMPGVPVRTDRPPPNTVKLAPVPPVAPDTLCTFAKEHWAMMVSELETLGLLARIDYGTLAAYCDAVAKHNQARIILDQQGLTIMGRQGEIKHPVWMVYNQAAGQIGTLAKHLFATPVSRLRSNLPEAPDHDSENDILD